jgi:hypothetical protein
MAKSKNKLLPTPAASIPPTIVSSPSVTSPNNSVLNTPTTPLSLKQQQSQSNLNSNSSNSSSSNPDSNVVNSNNSVETSPIAGNNINDVSITNDNDIIGHEIPTPECLPRKHSNIQSKLATTSTTLTTSTTTTTTS